MMMRIDLETLRETVADGIQALDVALIEMAARVADAEAIRLEYAADMEADAVRKELLAGARAARDIAAGIRKLSNASASSQKSGEELGA